MKLSALAISFFFHFQSGCCQRPYYNWHEDYDAESMETKNGVYPNLRCPYGRYRSFGDDELMEPGGLRMDGCLKCEKGYYGNTTDLQTPQCTAPCPKGTYRDKTGGKWIEDCFPCPVGTFGEEEGLITKDCSGSCTDLNDDYKNKKFFSRRAGLTSRDECELCPYGFDYYQCKWEWPDVAFDENLYVSDDEIFDEFYDKGIFEDFDNDTEPFPWETWNPNAMFEPPIKILI